MPTAPLPPPPPARPSRWVWVEQLGHDLRFALRQIRRFPGFAATVIATLALGIGACSIVFTLVNGLLLDPVGVPPGGQSVVARTVAIHEAQMPQRPVMKVSPPMYLDLVAHATSFASLSAWMGGSAILTDGPEPTQVRTGAMTIDQFALWRADMAAGRLFVPEDYARGGRRVAVITYGFWQREFGGKADLVGRTVHLDGAPYTVVGIMSQDFGAVGSQEDIWLPLVLGPGPRDPRFWGYRQLGVGGVLKPGVTVAQAQAELSVLAARAAAAHPVTNRGVQLTVQSIVAYANRFITPMLYVLLATVGCVLLVACTNVANLLLARATVRQRELSVRAALGAGRGRLMRQLLVESVLLAVCGGVSGVLLAAVGLHFVHTFVPPGTYDLGRLVYIHLDARMLGFTLAFSAVTGLFFGVVPAWIVSRTNLNEALKQGGRGAGDGARRGRLRSAFVILQVGLAVALLACTGLLVRSFRALSRVDLGYSPSGVAVLNLNLRARRYNGPQWMQARTAFVDDLLAHVKGLPGVTAAAITTVTPLNVPSAYPFGLDGRALDAPGNQPSAISYCVSPEFFRTLRVRVLAGRTFTTADTAAAPHVIVINNTLAKEYFGTDDPVGRQLNVAAAGAPPDWAEIIGVVNDVMQGGHSDYLPPQIFVPLAQRPGGGFFLLARTSGDPAALLPLLKAQVYAVDREQPVLDARTLPEWMNSATARDRLMIGTLTVFALLALFIAAVGIYAVMAYSVSQRATEFGIRFALGATRTDILAQVMRRGLVLVAIGVAAGLVGALAAGRLVSRFLFEVSARDPLTLAVIVTILLVVALAACLVPAWRATRVDPLEMLRRE